MNLDAAIVQWEVAELEAGISSIMKRKIWTKQTVFVPERGRVTLAELPKWDTEYWQKFWDLFLAKDHWDHTLEKEITLHYSFCEETCVQLSDVQI